ncbi:MAG: DUF2254 family protein [Euryarchaeota archaeon]|nr:DUF2254 family protein [Euryarchaeota archaeon]
MQGWKENASKVIQRIRKNRLVQWFYDKDISTQYRILFVIFASVIVIWNIVNIYFNSFEIDDTSARYLLSALVQSLAAIIAIVVTLTLVAVQLSASAYSPRVIDIFKEDKVMWWLLAWYGLSIFSGLFVLEMIGSIYSNSWCIIVPLEILVLLVYLMGIAAFAGLFWHIGNVIDLLKPEKIIKKLADKITKDSILNLKDDPIQPIVDIVHGSVMKYDITTTRVGLTAVTDRVIKILDVNCEQKIPMRFFAHLEQVSRLTVSKMDDESTAEVIKNWGDVLKEMAGEKCDLISHTDIIGFESFVASITKKELVHATSCAATSFGEITKIVIDEEKDYLTLAISLCALGKLGILAAEKNWDGVVLGVHGYLLQIGTALTGGSIRYKDELCRGTAYYCAPLEIFLEKVDKAYTPLIKPEDQEFFNEFKKQCEHELNKLRTQNPD